MVGGGINPAKRVPALLLITALMGCWPLRSSPPHTHAPSLSVYESCYGTSLRDGRRESIQGLEIRIVGCHDLGISYRVECFFLKRGKNGAKPSLDDVIVFDVTNPHGVYRVEAKPIPVGAAPTPLGKTSGKKSSSSKTSTAATPVPREGYLVRILHADSVVREHGSSHAVERFAAEDPEFFTKGAASKKVRVLQSADLLER